MKTFDWINSIIGNTVYINGDGDLGMDGQLRQLIFNKTKLTLLRITKKGLVEVMDTDGNLYYVRAKNISEL